MLNPLTLLPYALAAAGGRVNGEPAAALVAAGFTLLQRSAPLVRALALGSPAIVLPHGAAFVTALAACDGHVALLENPTLQAAPLRTQFAAAGVRVVFTETAFVAQIPPELIIVLLDEAPRAALVQVPGAEPKHVDLGSHVGLALEAEHGVDGSDADVLRWMDGATVRRLSHRDVMSELTHGSGAPAVVESLLRPLLRGESC